MNQNVRKMLNQIAQVVYDKKGTNIFALDVRGTSDHYRLPRDRGGDVDRHVTAIAMQTLLKMSSGKSAKDAALC